jgi:hypothetical protein
MIFYKKLYMESLGYVLDDFIPSEISGDRAVDVSHIIGKGRGGDDRIENLMAVTREEHNMYGENNEKLPYILNAHRNFLELNGVRYDNDWFEKHINFYKALNEGIGTT